MDGESFPSRTRSSYFLDWAMVIAVGVASLALVNVNPDAHDFSISDLSLSYAHRANPKVSLWLLLALVTVAPAVTITVTSFRYGAAPGRTKPPATLNHGLLGLSISLASACVILNIKNLAGKPRPDFLAICQPDLDNIGAHKVGGYGRDNSVMVYRTICQQSNQRLLNDAFRSFPSGHSTVAFAGLCYTTMWLCQILTLPLFTVSTIGRPRRLCCTTEEAAQILLREEAELSDQSAPKDKTMRSALPLPAYYLFLPYVPIGVAIFIAGTRYFDYRNHGVDVAAGAAGGIFSAYVGMKWIVSSIQ